MNARQLITKCYSDELLDRNTYKNKISEFKKKSLCSNKKYVPHQYS